jgi:hypothetical protein
MMCAHPKCVDNVSHIRARGGRRGFEPAAVLETIRTFLTSFGKTTSLAPSRTIQTSGVAPASVDRPRRDTPVAQDDVILVGQVHRHAHVVRHDAHAGTDRQVDARDGRVML